MGTKFASAPSGAHVGIWSMVRRYEAVKGGGGGGSRGGHNFTVKNQTKQWINDMYNFFMIYIILFIIL